MHAGLQRTNAGLAATLSLCSAATDVKVEDRPWPEAFAVEGSLSASFDRIPEGASVQHRWARGRAAAIPRAPP